MWPCHPAPASRRSTERRHAACRSTAGREKQREKQTGSKVVNSGQPRSLRIGRNCCARSPAANRGPSRSTRDHPLLRTTDQKFGGSRPPIALTVSAACGTVFELAGRVETCVLPLLRSSTVPWCVTGDRARCGNAVPAYGRCESPSLRARSRQGLAPASGTGNRTCTQVTSWHSASTALAAGSRPSGRRDVGAQHHE